MNNLTNTLNTLFGQQSGVKRLTTIPIGVDADGSLVFIPLANTAICGISGSGKSYLMDRIIQHYTAPTNTTTESPAERELVKFYGVDPKWSNLVKFDKQGVFTAFSDGEGNELLISLTEMMRDRFVTLNGRYKPTRQHPIVILFLEDLSTFDHFGGDRFTPLRELTLYGPAVGCYTILVSQQPEYFNGSEVFRNKVATKMLKQDSVKEFFNLPHLTEQEDYSNQYWTALVSTRPDTQPQLVFTGVNTD